MMSHARPEDQKEAAEVEAREVAISHLIEFIEDSLKRRPKSRGGEPQPEALQKKAIDAMTVLSLKTPKLVPLIVSGFIKGDPSLLKSIMKELTDAPQVSSENLAYCIRDLRTKYSKEMEENGNLSIATSGLNNVNLKDINDAFEKEFKALQTACDEYSSKLSTEITDEKASYFNENRLKTLQAKQSIVTSMTGILIDATMDPIKKRTELQTKFESLLKLEPRGIKNKTKHVFKKIVNFFSRNKWYQFSAKQEKNLHAKVEDSMNALAPKPAKPK